MLPVLFKPPSFTGFYWSQLIFSGDLQWSPYWSLPMWTVPPLVSNGLHKPEFISFGIYWSPPGVDLSGSLLDSTGFHWTVLIFIGLHWSLVVSVNLYWSHLVLTGPQLPEEAQHVPEPPLGSPPAGPPAGGGLLSGTLRTSLTSLTMRHSSFKPRATDSPQWSKPGQTGPDQDLWPSGLCEKMRPSGDESSDRRSSSLSSHLLISTRLAAMGGANTWLGGWLLQLGTLGGKLVGEGEEEDKKNGPLMKSPSCHGSLSPPLHCHWLRTDTTRTLELTTERGGNAGGEGEGAHLFLFLLEEELLMSSSCS